MPPALTASIMSVGGDGDRDGDGDGDHDDSPIINRVGRSGSDPTMRRPMRLSTTGGGLPSPLQLPRQDSHDSNHHPAWLSSLSAMSPGHASGRGSSRSGRQGVPWLDIPSTPGASKPTSLFARAKSARAATPSAFTRRASLTSRASRRISRNIGDGTARQVLSLRDAELAFVNEGGGVGVMAGSVPNTGRDTRASNTSAQSDESAKAALMVGLRGLDGSASTLPPKGVDAAGMPVSSSTAKCVPARACSCLRVPAIASPCAW